MTPADWLDVAESAIRDGEVSAATWANAIGSTMGSAIGETDFGRKAGQTWEGRLAMNAMVGGAMTMIDRKSGLDFIASSVGQEVGQSIGDILQAKPKIKTLGVGYGSDLEGVAAMSGGYGHDFEGVSIHQYGTSVYSEDLVGVSAMSGGYGHEFSGVDIPLPEGKAINPKAEYEADVERLKRAAETFAPKPNDSESRQKESYPEVASTVAGYALKVAEGAKRIKEADKLQKAGFRSELVKNSDGNFRLGAKGQKKSKVFGPGAVLEKAGLEPTFRYSNADNSKLMKAKGFETNLKAGILDDLNIKKLSGKFTVVGFGIELAPDAIGYARGTSTKGDLAGSIVENTVEVAVVSAATSAIISSAMTVGAVASTVAAAPVLATVGVAVAIGLGVAAAYDALVEDTLESGAKSFFNKLFD